MTRLAALLATCLGLSLVPGSGLGQETGPLAPVPENAKSPAIANKPAFAYKPAFAKSPGLAKKPKSEATHADKAASKAKAAEKAKTPEPWALADPARAGLTDAQAARDVPTPGRQRTAPSSDDKTSFGMKWSSSKHAELWPDVDLWSHEQLQ